MRFSCFDGLKLGQIMSGRSYLPPPLVYSTAITVRPLGGTYQYRVHPLKIFILTINRIINSTIKSAVIFFLVKYKFLRGKYTKNRMKLFIS